ncbi:hypothetical protein NDU88_003487 [Pleurodeles waltl]|uniref:Uncharacterized protein n=1 Tax=Pleurodeles waltl TaxID=8319 RepID=A0AAV7T5E7_PLEWA|nr:hypothetical protein NDU88_003487 [Pleurodeles waltl]
MPGAAGCEVGCVTGSQPHEKMLDLNLPASPSGLAVLRGPSSHERTPLTLRQLLTGAAAAATLAVAGVPCPALVCTTVQLDFGAGLCHQYHPSESGLKSPELNRQAPACS